MIMRSNQSAAMSPVRLTRMAALLAGMVAGGHGLAATVTQAELQEGQDSTVVVLTFDKPLDKSVKVFRVSNPDRQVIDFSESVDASRVSLNPGPGSRLKQLQWVSGEDRARLVVFAANPYTLDKVDNGQQLKLVFSGPKPYTPGLVDAAAIKATSPLLADVSKVVKSPDVVEHRPMLLSWSVRTEAGQDILGLEFDRPDVRIDSATVKDELRFRLPKVSMGDKVNRQLPDTPSGALRNLYLSPGDQALSVWMRKPTTGHEMRKVGNRVELVFNHPATPAQTFALPDLVKASATRPAMGKPEAIPAVALQEMKAAVSGPPTVKRDEAVVSNSARYIGRPISLAFKDADIRTVLQVFADFTKMNLVVSDSVQGKVTVHLKDVPWDQALEIVMRSKGLVYSQSGNVLLVSNAADLAGEQLDTAIRRAQDDMEPMVTRTFVVSYQKTADVVNVLKAKESKLLSARGTILSDERTSQIFIQDTPTRIARIQGIIESMDKPVKQVMIEARVVLADTTVSRELGVRVRGASSRSADFTAVSNSVGKQGFINSSPDASTTLAYTLLNSNSTRLLSLQLQALEQQDKIRTVSNPKVITSNKEPALIEQGTEIPYQIATSSGATAIEFKEANLKLEVTPQISPDGAVLLDVNVSKDSVGITTANGPAIDTRRVKTKVLVSDGGTVVLGGIFEEEDNDTRTKVPGLGDIPLFGKLFSGMNDRKRRAELLIFLTPVVLQDS